MQPLIEHCTAHFNLFKFINCTESIKKFEEIAPDISFDKFFSVFVKEIIKNVQESEEGAIIGKIYYYIHNYLLFKKFCSSKDIYKN